jgi:hypothetical protein
MKGLGALIEEEQALAMSLLFEHTTNPNLGAL